MINQIFKYKLEGGGGYQIFKYKLEGGGLLIRFTICLQVVWMSLQLGGRVYTL